MPDHPAQPPLHQLDPTGRFSSRAGDYSRFRPSYSPDAISSVLAGLGDPSRLIAADIGAGTGISSRLLADRGVRVIAVEPNAAMRDAAEPHPLVQWRNGAAEATGLPDSSVDLVLCAQAFHWFRHEEALAEFHRILKPRGRVALIWNDRDESDPFTAGYGRLIRQAADREPAYFDHTRPEALFASTFFRDQASVAVPNEQQLDEDGLVGRALSASYVPKAGPGHDALVRGLHQLFRDFAGKSSTVPLKYLVKIFTATRA